jgi:hypothetical protein
MFQQKTVQEQKQQAKRYEVGVARAENNLNAHAQDELATLRRKNKDLVAQVQALQHINQVGGQVSQKPAAATALSDELAGAMHGVGLKLTRLPTHHRRDLS